MTNCCFYKLNKCWQVKFVVLCYALTVIMENIQNTLGVTTSSFILTGCSRVLTLNCPLSPLCRVPPVRCECAVSSGVGWRSGCESNGCFSLSFRDQSRKYGHSCCCLFVVYRKYEQFTYRNQNLYFTRLLFLHFLTSEVVHLMFTTVIHVHLLCSVCGRACNGRLIMSFESVALSTGSNMATHDSLIPLRCVSARDDIKLQHKYFDVFCKYEKVMHETHANSDDLLERQCSDVSLDQRSVTSLPFPSLSYHSVTESEVITTHTWLSCLNKTLSSSII